MRRRLPLLYRPLIRLVAAWVRHAATSGSERRRASEFGHGALLDYYSAARLDSTWVVVTPTLPTPMLPTFGLEHLRAFVQGSYAAITLLDTFFVRPERVADPGLFAHELVHVVQWEHLGLRGFIETYGAGLIASGYAGCSLERQAYAHEERFESGGARYDIEAAVRDELDAQPGR
jgi:hypothetical protein